MDLVGGVLKRQCLHTGDMGMRFPRVIRIGESRMVDQVEGEQAG